MNEEIQKLLEDHPELTAMHGGIQVANRYDSCYVLVFEDGFMYILKRDASADKQ